MSPDLDDSGVSRLQRWALLHPAWVAEGEVSDAGGEGWYGGVAAVLGVSGGGRLVAILGASGRGGGGGGEAEAIFTCGMLLLLM